MVRSRAPGSGYHLCQQEPAIVWCFANSSWVLAAWSLLPKAMSRSALVLVLLTSNRARTTKSTALGAGFSRPATAGRTALCGADVRVVAGAWRGGEPPSVEPWNVGPAVVAVHARRQVGGVAERGGHGRGPEAAWVERVALDPHRRGGAVARDNAAANAVGTTEGAAGLCN